MHWRSSSSRAPLPNPLPASRGEGIGSRGEGIGSRGEGIGSSLPLPLAGEGRGEGKPLRIALAVAALLIGGCSISKWTVKPHQRELLADKIMQLDAEAQEREAEEHVLANREGAIGGTGTSGGGCGCN